MCGCGKQQCQQCGRPGRRSYRFTPALRAKLTEAYQSPSRRALTARLNTLARETGWPRFAFTQQAELMGITTCTLRHWTRDEDVYLREAAGTVSTVTMARRLRRSERAVQSRLQKMAVSRRMAEGYNIRDLAACFGVHEQTVKRWFDRGLFGKVHELGGANGRRVTEANVARFIRRHHGEYDMRRVDQVWFKAMVFEEATCRDGR